MTRIIIFPILFFTAFYVMAQTSGPDLDPATVYSPQASTGVSEGVSMVNENLKISLSDTRLLRNKDGSWELFIKKTELVESILITDSTVDPEAYSDSFSLRAYESHPTFANEKRILNNLTINNKERIQNGLEPLYFIMDSEASKFKDLDEGAAQWFHVHMPSAVMYGYPWSREGQFDIIEDTWISIRSFGSKYANYKNGFIDNPFKIARISPILEPPIPREKSFQVLAQKTRGLFHRAQKNSEIKAGLAKVFAAANSSNTVDVAFVIDATISMKYTVAYLQEHLVDYLVSNVLSKYPGKTYRIALVQYRDYKPDQYLTRESDFTDSLDVFQERLDKIVVNGGRDIPEAVYEGIDAAVDKLSWDSGEKIIIQMGDAIPHPIPKGNITQDSVIEKCNKNEINLYPILMNERLKEINE